MKLYEGEGTMSELSDVQEELARYKRALAVAQEFINIAQSCHAEAAGLKVARILEEGETTYGPDIDGDAEFLIERE